jgi:hypothetical protein
MLSCKVSRNSAKIVNDVVSGQRSAQMLGDMSCKATVAATK